MFDYWSLPYFNGRTFPNGVGRFIIYLQHIARQNILRVYLKLPKRSYCRNAYDIVIADLKTVKSAIQIQHSSHINPLPRQNICKWSILIFFSTKFRNVDWTINCWTNLTMFYNWSISTPFWSLDLTSFSILGGPFMVFVTHNVCTRRRQLDRNLFQLKCLVLFLKWRIVGWSYIQKIFHSRLLEYLPPLLFPKF